MKSFKKGIIYKGKNGSERKITKIFPYGTSDAHDNEKSFYYVQTTTGYCNESSFRRWAK